MMMTISISDLIDIGVLVALLALLYDNMKFREGLGHVAGLTVELADKHNTVAQQQIDLALAIEEDLESIEDFLNTEVVLKEIDPITGLPKDA